jgi:hypothetical protein
MGPKTDMYYDGGIGIVIYGEVRRTTRICPPARRRPRVALRGVSGYTWPGQRGDQGGGGRARYPGHVPRQSPGVRRSAEVVTSSGGGGIQSKY